MVVKDNLKRMREEAREIFNHALAAVDPKKAVRKYVFLEGNYLIVAERRYDLSFFKRIYVVGAGKASASMAKAIEEILGDRITQGLISTKYGYREDLQRIELIEAGHPLPDRAGVEGAKRISELVTQAKDDDLIICLISGGGSALLPLPSEGITLDEKQTVTRLLLNCGATINEINAIRKHISKVKGGQLARLAYPATLVSLILSDVIGDPLNVIASGMTVPDTSTYKEALDILKKYELSDKIPSSVLNRLKLGLAGEIAETPKEGDPIFNKVYNLVVGSNMLAVQAAKERAASLGYKVLILSTFIEGETREVAKVHAAIAKEILKSGNPLSPKACVISGGETTVTIKGNGLGGRNQEFALATAIEINGRGNVVILSGGTDGTDGPTDAAGAIADGTTIKRALKLGLNAREYLRNNDSYHFFKAIGDLLITGPTNTNVNDIQIILVNKP